MFSPLCRGVLHINHYHTLVFGMPNLQNHLADQAERKIFTEIDKEAASSMSIDIPLSPTTNHQPGIEADTAEKPILTTTQFGSSHESKQEAQQVDWRLSRLNKFIEPSRGWLWSEEEGDQAFDHGCEEWRKRSLAALEGSEDYDRLKELSRSSEEDALYSQDEEAELEMEQDISQDVHIDPETPSGCAGTTDARDIFNQTYEAQSADSYTSVPQPRWVQDYNERRPTTLKTPQQSIFDDGVQFYEAYSPEKLRTPPKMRFDHERDLLDLPELDQQADKQPGDLPKRSHLAALQSPERLLFLPDDDDTGSMQSQCSNSFTSPSETILLGPATTIRGETSADRTEESQNEQAPSNDNNVSDFSSFGNMLFVSILRQVVAAAGGLAALSDVFRPDENDDHEDDNDDDDDDHDDEEKISDLELGDRE
ncbi:hypothetical protein AC578_8360 [Pseudocercospora eumusae]|uniref:Uncharacterized protein n=1 Tax=Pseudocercospora eumusae TaxID=321146 RepID=A0A139HRS5_9PEZI|nr:hypothetical protein AC578_8360 [Pseudocercospora eumusae]